MYRGRKYPVLSGEKDVEVLIGMGMMRNLAVVILLAFGLGVRGKSLDGMWRFRTDPYCVGVAEGWWKPAFDRSAWDVMRVPGNWDTTPAYASYMGAAWYATGFHVKPKGNTLYRLSFEGVATDAEVWLNGNLVGSHDFAFTTFAFDVTSLLNPDGDNELVVKVDNRFKVGATWNYGGIRRPVSLLELPVSGIERVDVSAQTDSRKRSARVRVKGTLRGVSGISYASVSIKDRGGKVVASRKAKVKDNALSCELDLRNIHLWHFDCPQLYTARLEWGGDSAERRFGLREIEIEGEKFRLNGEDVKLCGANWVPDDRFTGNTLPAELYRRDIDMMKEAGVSMARLSHQGLPEEVLDYLDEKGMLIFEEIPLWNKNSMVTGNDSTPLRWLRELVDERISHPCIIGWSVGNEIGRHSDNPELEAYLRKAFGYLRHLDPDRLAVYVTHTAAKQPDEPAGLSDMILFNQYGAHGERVDRVHEYNPGKPVFYSEYGKTVNRPDLDATVDYRKMLDDMRGRAFLAGASVWTFNDYRTNYRDRSTDASGNRPWGAVDAYRRKKRAYNMLRRANSPLAVFGCTVDSGNAVVSVLPRESDEIPAFVMNGYAVKARAYGCGGTMGEYGLKLPVIKPGDAIRNYSIGFDVSQEVERVEVSLLAPTGYEVDRIVRWCVLPPKPVITDVEEGDTGVRIHFRHDEPGVEYLAEYDADGGTKRTSPTIENYIDVLLPEFGKPYDIRLVARNEKGETSSDALTVTTRAAILPPVILGTWVNGDEVYVAFTSDMQDYYYDIEYGLAGGEPERITVTTGGACVLPAVEPGKPHFVRLNRHLAYGYASPMSLTAVTDVIK